MSTRIYYLDESSTLQEFIFVDDKTTGHPGTLGEANITTAPDSRLAAYWPSVVYQNSDNTISEAKFNCSKSKDNDNCWNLENLNIKAYGPSAGLAEIPMGRASAGMYLYYQRDDEELVNSAYQRKTDEWEPCKYRASRIAPGNNCLRPLEAQFAQPIPPSSSVAVFATPRSENSTGLNIHVLWQSSEGAIQISDRKGNNNWSNPRNPPAMKNVRMDTNMACVTAPSWPGQEMVLEQELSRCFFMDVNGRLKQVQYDGKVWKSKGVIWNVSRDDKT